MWLLGRALGQNDGRNEKEMKCVNKNLGRRGRGQGSALCDNSRVVGRKRAPPKVESHVNHVMVYIIPKKDMEVLP
jgi:hypothetical protein